MINKFKIIKKLIILKLNNWILDREWIKIILSLLKIEHKKIIDKV